MMKYIRFLFLVLVLNMGASLSAQTINRQTVFKFRYLHWNIGHYSHGDDWKSAITAETYEQQKKAYRQLFAKYHADVVGLCEWSEIFYGEENATEALLNQYPFHYIAPTQRYYIGVAFHTALPLTDMHEIKLARGYTAYEGVIKVGKKRIIVCECHLPWQSALLHDSAQATLLERYANEPYVVIAGDFNFLKVDCDKSYQLWKDAGFETANRGYLGDLVTCPCVGGCSNYLDNIFVKGGKILNTMIEQTTPAGYSWEDPHGSSDPEERKAWFAVNLSDHFPMISDIVFTF